MESILIAPPTTEPVSLAEAKSWLRLDTSDEDETVQALISAARMLVENATRRALITQGWRCVLDTWPYAGADGAWSILALRPRPAAIEVVLPLAPVASVSGLRIYDGAGQPQQISTSLWRLVGAPERSRLVFAAAPPAPGAATAGIEIDVVAGYGAADDVPAALRHAILALVSYWFENRGDVATAGPDTLPPRAAALVAPFRRGRLA